MSRVLGVLILSWVLAGCGEEPRRCLERAECFAGEYCERGVCKPYIGRVPVDRAPARDMGGDEAPDR